MTSKSPESHTAMRSHAWSVQTKTGNVDRTTPDWLLDLVREAFGGVIDLDPCPHPDDNVQATERYLLSQRARDLMYEISVTRGYKPSPEEKKAHQAHVRSLQNALRTELNDPECPNGLLLPWRGTPGYPTRVFANIPYGRTETLAWSLKFVQEYPEKPEEDACILLLPAEVGAKWFQDVLLPSCDAVAILRGRLAFGPVFDNIAPFWSMLVYAGPDNEKFREVFDPYGWVSCFER